jgi:hypothetical protein
VQRIVARLDELSATFNGGDQSLSEAVRSAWREEPAALCGDPGVPADGWPDVTAYLERARAIAAARTPSPLGESA